MRYFLDTNIILDIFIKSRKNNKLVKVIINEIIKRDKDNEFWIDRESIIAINYILRKNPLKNEIAKEIIKTFNIANDVDILDDAIDEAIKNGLDFEDVLKVKAAEKLKAKVFITEDKKLLNADCFTMKIMNSKDIAQKLNIQEPKKEEINEKDIEKLLASLPDDKKIEILNKIKKEINQ